ncbi:hypothetical protein R1flu_017681 [Riccia fluitans]|uniref:Uncharacterized protein n=1 Tax=Riccia fluitans TaxID=41844 RepID=A0ABD1ZDN2_9MARC
MYCRFPSRIASFKTNHSTFILRFKRDIRATTPASQTLCASSEVYGGCLTFQTLVDVMEDQPPRPSLAYVNSADDSGFRFVHDISHSGTTHVSYRWHRLDHCIYQLLLKVYVFMQLRSTHRQ